MPFDDPFKDHLERPDLAGMESVPGFGSRFGGLTRPVPPNNQPPLHARRTSLPAIATTVADSVRQFYDSGAAVVPYSRLMPLGPNADPRHTAIAQSAVAAASKAAPPDVDPFLHFRGTWQSFTPYNINDVVLFNNSTYVAIAASTNVEPDSQPASVRQGGNSQNWAGAGRPASFTFASNLLAGSKILVGVTTGNLANQGG
jgi:hypothetical protein